MHMQLSRWSARTATTKTSCTRILLANLGRAPLQSAPGRIARRLSLTHSTSRRRETFNIDAAIDALEAKDNPQWLNAPPNIRQINKIIRDHGVGAEEERKHCLDRLLDLYRTATRFGADMDVLFGLDSPLPTPKPEGIPAYVRCRITIRLKDRRWQVVEAGTNPRAAAVAAMDKLETSIDWTEVAQTNPPLFRPDGPSVWDIDNLLMQYVGARADAVAGAPVAQPGAQPEAQPGASSTKKTAPKLKVDLRTATSPPQVWTAELVIGGEPVAPNLACTVVGAQTGREVLPYAHEMARLVTASYLLRHGLVDVSKLVLVPEAKPTELVLNEGCLRLIQQTLTQAKRQGLLPSKDSSPERAGDIPVEVARIRGWYQSPRQAAQRSRELKRRRETAQPVQGKVVLPMNDFAQDVLDTVASNHYSIIVGETGSGKTTQVPQILLDKAIDDGRGAGVNIICTQPRRIAATSVATRVAAERGEALGQTVGYHVRHDARLPSYGGSITYCTTGILLKQLQHSPDEVFDATSHIVLDEVHERDISLDFTLIILKRIMIDRSQRGKHCPKLILMSATLDTETLKDYFQDKRLGNLAAPSHPLHVPGRIFPVQRHLLNDIMNELEATYSSQQLEPITTLDTRYLQTETAFSPEDEPTTTNTGQLSLGLLTTLVAHIVKTTESGAILVFLPGMREIVMVKDMLQTSRPLGVDFDDANRFMILKLHSMIDQDQRTVFKPAPLGVRKIILATNMAETSITIPEVTAVVDSGLVRRMQYNADIRRQELLTTFVSQSNLAQRAGRAGRVRAGHYYGLYHKDRIGTLTKLPIPEMRLADLAEVGLHIKAQRNSAPIVEFLADAVEPPPKTAVVAAVNDLSNLGATTEDEKITALGQVLAKLPMHPALGKLVVLGIVFQCLDPMITLVVAAGARPWDRGTELTEKSANAERFRLAEGSFSEHLALLHAVRDLRAAVREDAEVDILDKCRAHFLRPFDMQNIDRGARQVEEILAEAGLISLDRQRWSRPRPFSGPIGPADLNANSGNDKLIRAVLAAGLSTNIAWKSVRRDGRRTKGYATADINSLTVSTAWIKALAPYKVAQIMNRLPLMLFDSAVYTDVGKQTNMSTATPISPLAVALFGSRARASTLKDRRALQRRELIPGNLTLGIASEENRKNTEAPRLLSLMVVRARKATATPEDDDGAVGVSSPVAGDNKARDMLLRFRAGLNGMLDRVLQNLSRGLPVDKDPARRLFVDALVDLVEKDEFRGLEQAMDVINKFAHRPVRQPWEVSGGRGPVYDDWETGEQALFRKIPNLKS